MGQGEGKQGGSSISRAPQHPSLSLQVQQQLPSEVLQLFHTPAVDRFLRTLILYLYYYVQVRLNTIWTTKEFTKLLLAQDIFDAGHMDWSRPGSHSFVVDSLRPVLRTDPCLLRHGSCSLSWGP